MALTEVYVDPSINADSGTGTSGDPYGDLEYACEQTTLGADGTRFNIKSGTAEVLAAELSVSMALGVGPGLAGRHIIFEGYTTTAGDGGVGEISGGGSVSIINDTAYDYIHFKNLTLTNTGANLLVRLDNNCSVVNCTCHNWTSGNGIHLDAYGLIANNYIYNGSGNACQGLTGTRMFGNYIDNTGANSFTTGLNPQTGMAYFNIVSDTNADITNGILINTFGSAVHNSVWSNGGAGTGISMPTATQYAVDISSNIVAGFSGVGGVGISYPGEVGYLAANACYNNETDYSTTSFLFDDDNEVLTEDPFTNAAAGDFSPVDTGNVKEGALPNIIGGGLV